MTLVLVTPPTAEPVTAAEAQQHARIENSLETSAIDRWITAARGHAEAITGRQLPPATWDMFLPAFPSEGRIRIPRPPLKSLTSIKYVDEDGALQTWDPSKYLVDRPVGDTALEAYVAPAHGEVYPATRVQANAVQVTFEAGYDALPAQLHSAILAGVAELYLNRERPSLDKAMNQVLQRFKVWSFD